MTSIEYKMLFSMIVFIITSIICLIHCFRLSKTAGNPLGRDKVLRHIIWNGVIGMMLFYSPYVILPFIVEFRG